MIPRAPPVRDLIFLIDMALGVPARRRYLARSAFVLTVAYAGLLFWIAPYPPMADLPQHAGQVALLRDLLFDRSPWQHLLRINLFTPYWIGYGPASTLSLLMPVSAALKLMLTLAYYAFVTCCVLLRRKFQGDERLDWLFIPGYFGMCYAWGFFTFLIAAPIGLFFILMADRYAEKPTIGSGIRLAGAGLVLFFSHGLIFLFAAGIGLGLTGSRSGTLRRTIAKLLPYLPLLVLALAYALISNSTEAATDGIFPPGIVWRWDWRRLAISSHIFGGYEMHGAVFAAISTVVMLWSPRFLRSPLNRRNPAAFVPMALMVIVWFAAPHYAMKTSLLFERFSLFILPLYALMFGDPTGRLSFFDRAQKRMQAGIFQVVLAVLCWIFLAAQTQRLVRFAHESEDFSTVRSAAEPGQRALTMAFDASSPAAGNPWAYLSYPLWYQAENQGLVDFNSAWFPPQIVRYRGDHLPAVRPDLSMGPQHFNWHTHQGWQYRYFFVRSTGQIPESLFANEHCQVVHLKTAGSWSLYERRRCQ